MDSEKLQKLHETLSKLAPRGKVGGLGYNSFAKQAKSRDDSLPRNGINFPILVASISLCYTLFSLSFKFR